MIRRPGFRLYGVSFSCLDHTLKSKFVHVQCSDRKESNEKQQQPKPNVIQLAVRENLVTSYLWSVIAAWTECLDHRCILLFIEERILSGCLVGLVYIFV